MSDEPRFAWPGGCQAAISITFDDGTPSHLSIAIPRMNERGLRGTFYLNPRGDDWQVRLAPWRAAQEAGHEMGNHTIAHPCSQNVWPILTRWTLEQIEADIAEAQRRLDLAFPGERERSFAYPCYESDVGRGPTRRSYVPVVAKYHLAARAKGNGMRGNHPVHADLHRLSSWDSSSMPFWQMVGLIEYCVTEGWWGIFTFHGVNETKSAVTETDLVSLLDYLNAHRERVWTAPVIKVARYITDHVTER